MSEGRTEQVDRLVARWRSMPPILRFGLAIALAVVAYVLVNDYAWAAASRLDGEANQIARTLDRALAARDELRRDLENAVVARGQVRLPVDENRGKQAMADTINEILRRRTDIGSYSFDSGAVSGFGRGGLAGVLPRGQGARVMGEVKFESSPEDAMAVIAEIESDPSIHGISRVQLTRAGTRRIAVILSVETWIATSGEAGGRIVR